MGLGSKYPATEKGKDWGPNLGSGSMAQDMKIRS